MAVDLDGTLLRSDMLYESLWSALAQHGWRAVAAVGALVSGRAALKSALAEMAQVDVRSLPFDDAVMDRIKAWRAQGGRAVLATATDQRLAEAVAAHLGLFDAVHGSTATDNLKGARKAAILGETYPEGYAYIGDSVADLPIWESAVTAISAGAPPALRRILDASPMPAEHLERPAPRGAFLRALRPQQWLKNLLVLIPLILTPTAGLAGIWGILASFVALSLAASAGYLINDLLDLGDDRSHPRKRTRPLAAGDLSPGRATFAIPLLLAGALGIAGLGANAAAAGIVAVYFIATCAYSVRLKEHTMVDICLLAFLFTLRVIAGGVALGMGLSVWLLAFSMFLFFSLASVKRLAELADAGASGRAVSRRGYRPEDRGVLSQMAIASGYLAVLVFALYLDQPIVQQTFGAPWVLWGICPLLIFWISRVVLVAERGEMHDDPMIFAVQNRTSRLVMAFCGVMLVGAMVL